MISRLVSSEYVLAASVLKAVNGGTDRGSNYTSMPTCSSWSSGKMTMVRAPRSNAKRGNIFVVYSDIIIKMIGG